MSELRRREIEFRVDAVGRYEIALRRQRLLVSLDNLDRDLVGDDGDPQRVAWLLDQVVASIEPRAITSERLYWCLELSVYADVADYAVVVSPQIDRVLVNVSEDGSLITWVTADDLRAIGLSAAQASDRAWSNLDAELRGAQVETEEVDGVTLAMLRTVFPSKASLALAPYLREVMSHIVGWPVLAVMPDRGFLYLWSAAHRDFISRLGGVVTREYGRASYPLTTEVFEIGTSIKAIGAFPP